MRLVRGIAAVSCVLLAFAPRFARCGSCKEAKLCCPGRDSSCVVQKAPINAIIEDLNDKPCYCDHACLKLGDCCDDFKQACGGSTPPLIHNASKPVLDQRGLWVDLDVTYEGVVVLTLLTKLNLMKLKQPPSTESAVEENPSAKWQNSDVDDTAESSTDDEAHFIPTTGKILDEVGNPVVGLGGSSNTSKKFIKMVDKIAESKFFQAATENRYIKKAMEGVSNTDLGLKVEVKGLVGTLVLNIPPPPSDRVWLGFRPTPKLWLSAQPIVGERNISFLGQLTSWIEKKLSQEFQKVLVIPNMEDILIPVMSPKLPE